MVFMSLITRRKIIAEAFTLTAFYLPPPVLGFKGPIFHNYQANVVPDAALAIQARPHDASVSTQHKHCYVRN